ncbi:MAG: hypothetical protein JWO26_87 [Rhodospirillales bacterium]|jgi:hypothetical protein|nr:hypothetical protein [Rhodospirillales bacterium]MDB5380455.1 hypothetical protein [Rhodospirillales bacterium]
MTRLPAKPGQTTAVSAFLDRLAAMPEARPASGRPARLLFAVDATASRQPSWDRACQLQAEMFAAAQGLGGIAISLGYWRGFNECAATPFLTDAAELGRRMAGVDCRGGQTQILRMLAHAEKAHQAKRLAAMILVGDAAEEPPDPICHAAGELGLRGVPVFTFLEGQDPAASALFPEIARLSGGAYAPFDPASAAMLRDLLRAVATYAAGGRRALATLENPAARRIVAQLPAPR